MAWLRPEKCALNGPSRLRPEKCALNGSARVLQHEERSARTDRGETASVRDAKTVSMRGSWNTAARPALRLVRIDVVAVSGGMVLTDGKVGARLMEGAPVLLAGGARSREPSTLRV